MRIESDIKLGFKDVMIRPKRSTLQSRSEVSLLRSFQFLHAQHNWEGIPIIAANMDTVGTFEMAQSLAAHRLMTAVHKHYSIEDWAVFLNNCPESISDYIALSTGTSTSDAEKNEYHFESPSTIKIYLYRCG